MDARRQPHLRGRGQALSRTRNLTAEARISVLLCVVTEPAEATGERFGDYEVESFLGKGSIGKVYLARHRRIGRRVALKTVHLEQKFEDDEDRDEFYKRLQREAELCAAMQHPNIVTLYEVGYDGDAVSFLATEYVDGESLLARLRRTKPLPLAEAIAVSRDILRGLEYAHSKGVIHRDIKPANILLTSEGRAKIADFGVARPLNSSLTTTRSLVGTPNYMSPEQVKTAPVSTRSDLFSAGVLMYELLTGYKPFASPDLSGILYNVVNLVPQRVTDLNPAVPEPLARIVTKLLEKAPENRYASATEALADLDRAEKPDTPTLPALPAATPSAPLPELRPTLFDAGDPAPPRQPALLRRPVPAAIFWSVTLVLGLALSGSVYLLREAISRQQPTGVITREQHAEAEAKRRGLDEARGHIEAKRYEEAVRAYDLYLARYPESMVARTEREKAQLLLAESAPDAEITRVAPKRTSPKVTKDEKPPSRWDRVKRWFRGK